MLLPALDLTRYHARFDRGDIIVFLTWWLGSDEGPRPCIALMPQRRQSWQRAKPAVVLLDQAWVWDEKLGDPERCARLCFAFADGMGFVPDPRNIMRIRSLIHDHLGDLLSMPPMPGELRFAEHQGDMTITERETGKVREIEVTERL